MSDSAETHTAKPRKRVDYGTGREALLNAAVRVVARGGVGKLTYRAGADPACLRRPRRPRTAPAGPRRAGRHRGRAEGAAGTADAAAWRRGVVIRAVIPAKPQVRKRPRRPAMGPLPSPNA